MGKWLNRLRNASNGIPTKPTKPGSVSSVSAPSDSFQEKAPIELAAVDANEPQPSAWLDCVGRLLSVRPTTLLDGGYLTPCDLVELAGCDARLVAETIRSSPTWINRPHPVEPHVERIVEIETQQPVICTAATATHVWRTARDHFYDHLMDCSNCHAPLGRYCQAGAERRAAYSNTPMEPTQ